MEALDLLERMLVFEAHKRIDAAQSLSHSYVAPYHDPSDEPISPQRFDWSFNDADLPVSKWMSMIYTEILGEPFDRIHLWHAQFDVTVQISMRFLPNPTRPTIHLISATIR